MVSDLNFLISLDNQLIQTLNLLKIRRLKENLLKKENLPALLFSILFRILVA